MLRRARAVSLIVVCVERLVGAGYLSEKRVSCFGRADVVLQADVDDYRAGYPVGEVYAVEVGERLLHLRAAFGMQAQVVVYFLVWVGVGELNGIHEPREVRRSGGCGADFGAQGGDGDGQSAALATSGDSDARRVRLFPAQQKIHAAPCVRVESAIRVNVAVDDAVCEQAGVSGVELRARAQLAARGEGEGGVTAFRPLFGDCGVALVSGRGDDCGQRRAGCGIGRKAVPCGDSDAVEAVVEGLEDVDAVSGAHRLRADFGGKGDGVRLGADFAPESVEIRRLAYFGLVVGVDGVCAHGRFPLGKGRKARGFSCRMAARVERVMGFEPTTSCLGSRRSAPELHPLAI